MDGLRGELGPDMLEDLRLLVTELVTNSVRYASGSSVDLRVRITRRRVRVEVGDSGRGFAQRSPPEPTAASASGRGLYFVERLADRWGVEQKRGTRVWFEIDR